HRDLHSFPTRRSSDLRKIDESRKGEATEPSAEKSTTLLADSQEAHHTAGVESKTNSEFAESSQLKNTPRSSDSRDFFAGQEVDLDRKSTRLNSSHVKI